MKLILKLTFLHSCLCFKMTDNLHQHLKCDLFPEGKISNCLPAPFTHFIPTSSATVAGCPVCLFGFQLYIPVRFYPWPFSVPNHHRSCPASHLCCSGPARLCFHHSSCPAVLLAALHLPLAWCCHDVDLCCQHEVLPITTVSQKALHGTSGTNWICFIWCAPPHKYPHTQGFGWIIGDSHLNNTSSSLSYKDILSARHTRQCHAQAVSVLTLCCWHMCWPF